MGGRGALTSGSDRPPWLRWIWGDPHLGSLHVAQRSRGPVSQLTWAGGNPQRPSGHPGLVSGGSLRPSSLTCWGGHLPGGPLDSGLCTLVTMGTQGAGSTPGLVPVVQGPAQGGANGFPSLLSSACLPLQRAEQPGLCSPTPGDHCVYPARPTSSSRLSALSQHRGGWGGAGLDETLVLASWSQH